MKPLSAIRKTVFVLAVALACAAGASFLPDNAYQRWQLTEGTIFDQLRWAYERIHFDPRPVDIAILGPSRTLLGLSEKRIDERLAAKGLHVTTANFSVLTDGRNIQWEILKELFKTKHPKVIVVELNEKMYNYGHHAFPLVAPARDMLFPPGMILSHYIQDLKKLPIRQLKLFTAQFLPDAFGLRASFDKDIYAKTRTDFTSGTVYLDRDRVDMESSLPADLMRRRKATPAPLNILDRWALKCGLEGDDLTYIRDIVRIARANGAVVIFDYFPVFEGEAEPLDKQRLEGLGAVIGNGDLASDPLVFANWGHFNHKGADIASDRLAEKIIEMSVFRPDTTNLGQ